MIRIVDKELKVTVTQLARDLTIAWRNIYNALLFYKTYPILQTVSAKLSWSHYVELITIQNAEERDAHVSTPNVVRSNQ
ncbi:hypothetical protein KKB84_02270 [bacterium]|nr:hypothetical protein [bacterium]MBU1152781.1 hypothetical protein [bacterium]